MSKSKGKRGGGSKGGSKAARGPTGHPLKGMLVGVAIIGALSLFFLMPVKGRTPFSHLLRAIQGEPEAERGASPASKAQTPQGRATPVKPNEPVQTARLSKGPARPALARDAHTAPPMDAVSTSDEAKLDRLVKAP